MATAFVIDGAYVLRCPAIHRELLETRKVALRLGRPNNASAWRLIPAAAKRLRLGRGGASQDADFRIGTRRKGVDRKLGLDVAAMAFTRRVDRIILAAGDADPVSATKPAHREGSDVGLEMMGQDAAEDLHADVDGVRMYNDREDQ